MKKELVSILSTILGVGLGAGAVGYVKGKTIDQKVKKVDKFKSYYNMLNQWLIIKQEEKTLVQYFMDNGYKSIAIYGMGEMGNRLYDELKNSGVTVKYAIDKSVDSVYAEVEIYDVDDTLEEVDAVVVTAIFAMDEIEELLSAKMNCPIISLEDVVYEV